MSDANADLSVRALEQLPYVAVILDSELLVRRANAAARKRFEPPDDDPAPALEYVLGRSGRIPRDVRQRIIACCRTAVQGPQSPEGHDAVIAVSSGHSIEFHARYLGADRWLMVMEDRKGRADPRAILDETCRDPLTGLGNRKHLDLKTTEALTKGETEHRPAILVFDIDRFGDVNDRMGQAGGDELLRAMAGRLWGATRGTDQIIRLDGDLFAILQINGDGAEKLAARLVSILSRPYLVRGEVLTITVSAGIAHATAEDITATDLLRQACEAWREAKGAGGNFWFRYGQTLPDRARSRRDLEADVRDALSAGQMSIVYQPKLDLRTGTIQGFEALARWRHPTRGDVPPSLFIPVAEDIGAIHDIGAWAIRAACETALIWPEHLTVSVNVSPRQMEDGWRFLNQVASILSETGLAPNRLELELEESALIRNPEGARAILGGLRDLGVRLALDDFGAGPASLRTLRTFPFDTMKIDQSFVEGLDREPDAAAVIQALAALGRGLHMTVVAPGVETEGQARMVERAGCRAIQGYLISEPVSPENIPDLLVRDLSPAHIA